MGIKELTGRRLREALPMVWEIFLEYEAVNYSEEGKKAFWEAIHSEEYLNQLVTYGAYENHELIGIIATRNEGSHIALFFVKGMFHGKGIGRKLWNAVLEENTLATITVHSSLFAVPIYEKLGFTKNGDVKEECGIQYVPMKYEMYINKDCPCKKEKCERHGHCNECRAHHAESNRQRPCEKN